MSTSRYAHVATDLVHVRVLVSPTSSSCRKIHHKMRKCSANTTASHQPCYKSHALRRWHHAERSDAALGLHAASLLASSSTPVSTSFGICRSSCVRSVQSKPTRAGVAKHAVSQQQESVAAAETPLRQKLAEFNRTIDTESGVLRILPLQARWLEDCAEMLADAFVDAKVRCAALAASR